MLIADIVEYNNNEQYVDIYKSLLTTLNSTNW